MTLCLFVCMKKSCQNEVYLYRKNLLLRSKFLSIKELTSIEKDSETENGRVISPENVFILFKDKGHRFRNVVLSFDYSFLKVNNFSMPG